MEEVDDVLWKRTLGSQDGKRRRVHWAMAMLFVNVIVNFKCPVQVMISFQQINCFDRSRLSHKSDKGQKKSEKKVWTRNLTFFQIEILGVTFYDWVGGAVTID